jgi:cell division protein FtsI/penicillin-binding protein 2
MEQRMPGNIWRPVRVGEGETAENGKDIVTTLDVDFQDITQFALNNALIQYQADHGCAIVMEVNTGAIKAIANLKRSADGLYYEKNELCCGSIQRAWFNVQIDFGNGIIGRQKSPSHRQCSNKKR